MSAQDYLKHTVSFQQDCFQAGTDPSTIYALISLEPQAISGRMPLDVRLVLDRSYSMEEWVGSQTKLSLLKEAMIQVVERLESGDRVSVVTFCNTHQVLVFPTVIQSAQDKRKIQSKIQEISPGGGTRMSTALNAALKEDLCPDYVTRLIFFTDGMICCGNNATEESKCLNLAEKSRHQIPWLIFATGVDYDDEFLSAIAETNGGRYDHISDVQAAADLFTSEINLMGEVALTHLMVSLETRNGFQLQQVNRVVPEIKPVSFQSLDYCSMDLGELDRVRGQKVLVQLQGTMPNEGNVTIAEVSYSYNLPLRKLLNLNGRFPMDVSFTNDLSRVRADHDVIQTIQLTGASQLYTLGVQALQQGNHEGATRTLTQAAELYTRLGQEDMGTKIKTLTTHVQGAVTEDVRRTLSTQVRYTVNRTLTNESGGTSI